MLEDTKSIQSNLAYKTGKKFPPGRGVHIGDDKNAAFYMSIEPHKRSELKPAILRLVFTSDGVGVRVVTRSVELYDLVKTAF